LRALADSRTLRRFLARELLAPRRLAHRAMSPRPIPAQHTGASAALGLGIGLALSVACGENALPVADAIRLERGPLALDLAGAPNGLFWDDSAQRLYVTDDDGNRILAWTDERGLSSFEQLPPAASEGAGLGQLVRARDGSLVVTRFGYGTQGDVVVLSAGGAPRIVPGLDVTRRRIGLARATDGTLYDAWFVQGPSGERAGAVAQLSLDGSETELITGLRTPVGVLAVADQLFVSDRELGQIWSAPRADPAAHAVFASLEQPRLLAAGPAGSIFVGSSSGDVYRIDADGSASTFQTGLREVRGVAYDAGERRLFIAERDPSGDDPRHALHISPVD
jgi:hypothetical protein